MRIKVRSEKSRSKTQALPTDSLYEFNSSQPAEESKDEILIDEKAIMSNLIQIVQDSHHRGTSFTEEKKSESKANITEIIQEEDTDQLRESGQTVSNFEFSEQNQAIQVSEEPVEIEKSKSLEDLSAKNEVIPDCQDCLVNTEKEIVTIASEQQQIFDLQPAIEVVTQDISAQSASAENFPDTNSLSESLIELRVKQPNDNKHFQMDNEDIDVYEKNEEPEIEIHQDNSYPTENFKEYLASTNIVQQLNTLKTALLKSHIVEVKTKVANEKVRIGVKGRYEKNVKRQNIQENIKADYIKHRQMINEATIQKKLAAEKVEQQKKIQREMNRDKRLKEIQANNQIKALNKQLSIIERAHYKLQFNDPKMIESEMQIKKTIMETRLAREKSMIDEVQLAHNDEVIQTIQQQDEKLKQSLQQVINSGGEMIDMNRKKQSTVIEQSSYESKKFSEGRGSVDFKGLHMIGGLQKKNSSVKDVITTDRPKTTISIQKWDYLCTPRRPRNKFVPPGQLLKSNSSIENTDIPFQFQLRSSIDFNLNQSKQTPSTRSEKIFEIKSYQNQTLSSRSKARLDTQPNSNLTQTPTTTVSAKNCNTPVISLYEYYSKSKQN